MGADIRRLLGLLETRDVSFGTPEATWAVVHEMVRETLLSLASSQRLYNMKGVGAGGVMFGTPREDFPVSPALALFGSDDPSVRDITLTNADRAAARMIGTFAYDFIDVIPERWRDEALPPSARAPPSVGAPTVNVTVPTEEIRDEIRGLGEQLGEQVNSGLVAGFERLTASLPLIFRGAAAQPGYAPSTAPEVPQAPPPPAAEVPRAPPAGPQISEQAARNAWNLLSPQARQDILIRIGTEPFTAHRVSNTPWGGLNVEYRIDLLSHSAEWIPKPTAPPSGSAFKKRQVTFGEEGGTPVSTSRFTNLAVRLEPKSLEEVYTDNVVSNTAAVDFLKAVVRSRDVPPFIVLYGSVGGTGKTSMARAFARDYLRHTQEELERRGVPGVRLVTASGAPIAGIESGYNEFNGDAFAQAETRIAIGRFLRRGNPDTAVYPWKKVLIIDDADKIPASTISSFKDLLQSGAGGETTITRNNVIIVTTNLSSFLVDTPLGSRAVRFEIRPLSADAIADYLRAVAPAEGLTCDEGVYERISRRVSGSIRDALNELGKEVLAGHCRVVGA